MAKLSKRFVDPQDFGHYVNNLWSVFTMMDDKEDIRSLFKDLFTHTEYKMFAKRLEIARRLFAGQTYIEIGDALKVTARTINSVSNILSSGGEGLRKADLKLKLLEKKYQKVREDRQAVLERRRRPKMPGETILPKLLEAGVAVGVKMIVKNLRTRSASKTLSS